jgi:hypothetical protein
VGKKNLEDKSTPASTGYEKLWKDALADGVCPVDGCDLTTSTCRHLDKYIDYTLNKTTGFIKKGVRRKKLRTVYTTDIDEFGIRAEVQEGHPVWDFYKKIKSFGLARDQIGILVRHFGAGMSVRSIMREMGWTSFSSYYSRYREALDILKKRGFGNE